MFKRTAFALLCFLGLSLPGGAANLATLAITTAQSGQTGTIYQFRDGPPVNLILQGKFTYGSGGTSVDAWIQTTFDGGTTWCDLANFHFTTSSLQSIDAIQGDASNAVACTNATLSANTYNNGIIGSQLRVKWTSVGTYAGNTTLAIDVQSRSRVVQ